MYHLKFIFIFVINIFNQFPSVESNRRFPISEFFNLHQNSRDIVSRFVCSYMPYQTKYCTCSARYFWQHNWCIDIFWMDRDDFTLDSYIKYLTERYHIISAENNYLTCEPVISPLKNEHISQRLRMHSTFIDENNTRKTCGTAQTQSNTLFTAVYDEVNSNLYTNKFCALANNVRNFTILELKVDCADIGDVKVNMTLDAMLLEKLQDCSFSIHPKTSVYYMQCANGLNDCPVDNDNFLLCNAYIAPIRGYRNRHCYACANKVQDTDWNQTISQIEVNECSKKLKSRCIFGVDYKFADRNGFYLIDDKEKDALIVTKMNYVFPATRFFDAYNHTFESTTTLNSMCCTNRPSCWKFKSCCADVLWDDRKPMELVTYKALLVKRSAPYREHHCSKLIPHSEAMYPVYYYMITTCLSNSTKDERRKCTSVSWKNIHSYVPVIGEGTNLYRNSFCARCNSVNKYEYVKIISGIGKGGFQFRIDLKDEFVIKQCDGKMNFNNTCPPGHPYQKLCQSFTSPTQSFRNVFCHLCNYPNDKVRFSNCYHGIARFFGRSMVLTLTPNGRKQLYSPFGDVLVDKLDMFLEKGCMGADCDVSQPSSHIDVNDALENCMSKENDLSLYVINHDTEKWSIKTLLLILGIPWSEVEPENNDIPLIKLNQTIDEIKSKYDELNSTLFQHGNTSLVISPRYKSTLSDIHQFMTTDDSTDQIICEKLEEWDLSEVDILKNCSINYNNAPLGSTYGIYMHILLDKYGVRPYIGKCKKYFYPKSCHIKMVRSEDVNEKLILPSSSNKVTTKVYEHGPSNSLSVECPIVNIAPLFLQIEGYISNIGTFISIIGYSFLILTYRINSKMWNTPGKLIVALCSSLLVGDCMYLFAWFLRVTDYNQILQLCETVGIMMHLSWLTAHLLNVVTGYDMLMRFKMLQSRWSKRDSKILLNVIICVVLSTMLIVLTAILCDHYKVILIGYGDGGVCVPHKVQGRLYFYIIPVAISILLSVICIIMILYKVWIKSKQNQKSFRNSIGRQIINMMLITFALGLIEGIGFIQVIGSSNGWGMLESVFSLLYSVCRSLRGLILSIIFICRKEALEIYKEKFNKVDKSIKLGTMDATGHE